MNYDRLLEKTREYVLSYYKKHENPNLVYHNRQHTEDVVDAATQIAGHYQLSEGNHFVVIAAAWFHDIGYMVDIDNHEDKGIELATTFFEKHKLEDIHIKLVCGCIAATKMPQSPTSLIEEILCDADLFHLGMDEENAEDQRYLDYVVIRQNDLWWHDLFYLIAQVEKNGCRSWIWSDVLWHKHEAFFKKMPKSVLQSNWYYDESFDEKLTPVKAYLDLESYGYDQVPTGGFYKKDGSGEKSILNTVKFCDARIAAPRLYGFLQTFWAPTTEENRESILKAIALTGEAKRWFDQQHKKTH